MRLLFSATPAYGHLLPLAPLLRAAAAAGHETAVLTSGDAAAIVDEAMPGTELLAAGVMPLAFTADAIARTGGDAMAPDFDTIGEIFGGSRLALSLPAALDQATNWAPDLLVCDSSDAVGPFVASALERDWVRAATGPEYPRPVLEAIERASTTIYNEHGVTRRPPLAYIDPWPEGLQTPGFASPVDRWPMRIPPHRRRDQAWTPPASTSPDRPTVLVTLGTIFSTTELLNTVVTAVAVLDVNVVATRGYSMVPTPSGENSPKLADLIQAPNVTYVSFTPLGELLDGVDLVVTIGGSGTVLGALTRGIPLVVWPQGADQFFNADRVQHSGAGEVVAAADALAAAVSAVLHDDSYRRSVATAAEQIATAASPEQVVERLTAIESASVTR